MPISSPPNRPHHSLNHTQQTPPQPHSEPQGTLAAGPAWTLLRGSHNALVSTRLGYTAAIFRPHQCSSQRPHFQEDRKGQCAQQVPVSREEHPGNTRFSLCSTKQSQAAKHRANGAAQEARQSLARRNRARSQCLQTARSARAWCSKLMCCICVCTRTHADR